MFWYVVTGGALVIAIAKGIAREKTARREASKKKAEKERLLLHEQELLKDALRKLIDAIYAFNKNHTEITKRYISGYDAYQFISTYRQLYDTIRFKAYKVLPDFRSEQQLLERFEADYVAFPTHIDRLNEEFVRRELEACSDLLDNVEGKSLDEQQREAVIINQDNSLVIAGAGSGKTTTIAGKVLYLTKRLGVDPKEILLISYTRKSADEMSERIRKDMKIELDVKTFHKLGLDIIADCEGEKPSIFSLSQKETQELIASFITNAKSDTDYFQKLLDFFAYFLKPYKDLHSFASDSEHNNYLKEQKLEGYKVVEKINSQGETLRYRERLKSQEEVLIANFLFRNNIRYEYEEKYQYKTASKKFGQYKPDFYLPDFNVYIEHFGLDEHGNVPGWFRSSSDKTAQARYTEGIEWKRNEHQFNGTILVESYSWEQRKGILLSNLQAKLEEQGVIFDPMSDTQLWEYIQEQTPEDIDVFTQLLATFLTLFKSNNESLNKLADKASGEGNQRAGKFLELFEPILASYQNYLMQDGAIDFSDMINSAASLVGNYRYASPYRYIIIDEFQDISQSRFQLIKALMGQHPVTKLFCVGDDWQSIYRFAGSDIGLFTGFTKHFSDSGIRDFFRITQVGYIENTYRFNNKLIELSGNFILKNPNQIVKSLKSNKHSTEPAATIHRYGGERNGREASSMLEAAMETIGQKAGGAESSVLFLGRYGHDVKIAEQSSYISKVYDHKSNSYQYRFKGQGNLKIDFLTVHSSKGLQADYVIILNGNAGTYGFPSEVADDPLLNFLLSKADQYPNGEERRLFYVALTRTKEHVHILSSAEFPSKFVDEIEENESVTTLKCEWCDNGKLIERKGPFGYFFACNNSHYCNFTKKVEAKDFFDKAHDLFNEKQYEMAVAYYEKTIEVEPTYFQVHYLLGKSLFFLKDKARAAEHFSRAIENGGDFSDAHLWRGASLLHCKKLTEGIEDLLVAQQNIETRHSVHYLLAWAYFQTGSYIRAHEHIGIHLGFDPDNLRASALEQKIESALKNQLTASELWVGESDITTMMIYLKLAMNYSINIKFNYHKSIQFEGGVQSLRTVKPTFFKTVGNSLCIVGYCYMRNEDRTFNVDRIGGLVINPGTIEFWSQN